MKKITLIITLLLLVQWTNAQDNCASALPITAGLHVISTIDGTQVPTPICADNGAITSANPRGEWYSYTPTGSYTVTVTTSLTQNNPLVDTRFHVYTGTCSTLTCYAGDDDSGNNYSSTSVFNVTAGTTYYIAFDNRWTSSGFTFQLMENPLIVIPPSPITFTSQNIPTINSNYNLCAVDMNNDQRDDIVGVSTSNIRIHFQNANGTFTVTDFPTSAATYTPSWSIAAGDYNKDGYNDLLYGSGSGLTFMKSNSTGTGYTQDTPG
ncbi:MAG TPA: VCBS repeat-containing protein, partial [Flavobacterium sp.]